MKKTISRGIKTWMGYSWGDKAFLTIIYTVMILVTVICVYPLYFTVIASVSDPNAVYTGKVFLLPKGFDLTSYKLVFQNKDIWTGYANTIFYTVVGTCYNLFLTIPAAYALSRKNMYGRGILTAVFLFTMYFSGGMIPTYIMMDKMELLNTRWALIFSGGVSIYNLVVTRTFFSTNFPDELSEAAKIDGASEFGIFFKIAIPLSMPIIAVMTLYYAVTHWNEYFNSMIYLRDSSKFPLQLVLRDILIGTQKAYESMEEAGVDGDILLDFARRAKLAVTMKYSLVFIASAPMLILYPFIQKHFVKGIMIGSLKG